MSQHNIIDLAYAAGILDGEGTFVISEVKSRSHRQRKNPQHVMSVAVSMTDPEIPVMLQDLFGGNLGTYAYNGYRPQTRWSISGERAAKVCDALIPYLRLKRRQAELAVRFQRGRKITPRGGVEIPPDELAARRTAMNEMRALNRRAV